MTLVQFFESIWSYFSGITISKTLKISLAMFMVYIAFDIYRKGLEKSLTMNVIKNSAASMGMLMINIIFIPIVYFAVGYFQAAYDLLGIPYLPQSTWDTVPIWLAVIISIFAYDFADYWNHRIMHHKLLWPIHAIHHSDTDVNLLTTYRVHFLEVFVMKLSYVILLSWLGSTPEIAVLGVTVLSLHNAYVHANVDWDHGPFKFLIASPRFHRWHHSTDPVAYGKNLANVIPLYDYIFGTYYNPHPCRTPVGAEGVPDTDVVKLTLFPFVSWANMLKGWFAKRRESPVNAPVEAEANQEQALTTQGR
ncbi:MAG: sterol desaturase family protein [Pseudomonadota bacterium]